MGPKRIQQHIEAGTLIWKVRRRGEEDYYVPYTREYAPAAPKRPYPSIWSDLPTMRQAKAMLNGMFHRTNVFDTPKPVELIERLLELIGDPKAIVLDPFAGSGTTGHAVLRKNKADGGTRLFVMIEMEAEVADSVTIPRLRHALDGYETPRGVRVVGLPGGARVCRLGQALFDPHGQIASQVRFADLAAHVFFVATGGPLPTRASGRTPLLGVARGTAVYLLFNGVLGDTRPGSGNVLTRAVLDSLPNHDGPRIVFGEACTLGAATLRKAAISFRQLPYQLAGD